jgi:hypothetical protein
LFLIEALLPAVALPSAKCSRSVAWTISRAISAEINY